MAPRSSNWSAVEAIFNSIRLNGQIEVGSLDTARRFIHVSDIASGIVSVIGREGYEVFNLSGNKLVTLGDIIDASSSLLKKEISIKEKSP